MKKLNGILRVTVFWLLVLPCIAISAERADRTFLYGVRSFKKAVSEVDKGANPTTNIALKKAISFFQQFIVNSPEDGMTPIAMELLGSAYALQKQYQLSTQKFNEVIQKFPNHPAATQSRYKIAENLYQQKKYDKAIAQFETVIAVKSNPAKAPKSVLRAENYFRPFAQFMIGNCLIKKNKKAEAKAAFQILVAKYPNHNMAKVVAKMLGNM